MSAALLVGRGVAAVPDECGHVRAVEYKEAVATVEGGGSALHFDGADGIADVLDLVQFDGNGCRGRIASIV